MWFRMNAAELVGNAIISLIMSAVMSVFMVAMNAGFRADYLWAVFDNWILGVAVSFPTALVVVPPIIRWQSRHQISQSQKTR